MTSEDIRRDIMSQVFTSRINATNRNGRVVRSQRESVVIEEIGRLRISTAIRVSPTVIRVSMPRRKTVR